MSIPVIDPFGVAGDPEMPTLAAALDPAEVQRRFGRGLPRLAGRVPAERVGCVCLQAIRVTRYKPGRRCVLEFDVVTDRPDAAPEAVTLVGKVRRRRPGEADYRLLSALWDAGFAADSPDGISVPEPIGFVPELQLWLQRKVPGPVATDLLAGPDGPALVERIAEAAHKLHQAGVRSERRHTMADELRILRERLPTLAEPGTRQERRIARLLDACDRLGAAIPEPAPRGIHRDFYPDQVIVDPGTGRRLFLIDFDLHCEGDPGLDIGNFLGHITEQSLRALGDPQALADREQAMEERFVALSGEATRAAVRAYATLTLVRHIHLSTLFPERRPFTGRLLELCEERLGHGHQP